jgi:hypothetical protein
MHVHELHPAAVSFSVHSNGGTKGRFLDGRQAFLSSLGKQMICNLQTPARRSIDEIIGQLGVRDEPKLVNLICALLQLPCAGVNRVHFNDFIIKSSSTTPTFRNHSLDPSIFHVPDLFDERFEAINPART